MGTVPFILRVRIYAPQTGLQEEVKEEFFADVERVIEGLAMEERLIVGADLNGHIGTSSEGAERIHGGFGFGRANAEERRVLKFAVPFDLTIANTYFARGRSTTSHTRVEEIRLK